MCHTLPRFPKCHQIFDIWNDRGHTQRSLLGRNERTELWWGFSCRVTNAPASPQRRQKASLANDSWLDLHHCWLPASELSLRAVLTPFQDLWSRWEEPEPGAAAETLEEVQRPADACGTSSVPLRMLPKVLLPTKLWMNWGNEAAVNGILTAERAKEPHHCSTIRRAEMP